MDKNNIKDGRKAKMFKLKLHNPLNINMLQTKISTIINYCNILSYKNTATLCVVLVALFAFPHKIYTQTLTASYYDLASLKREGTFKVSKGRMANNELFDENALTAASWDFPLKTKLRVTTVKALYKVVEVTVTDRTNRRFKGKRLDLSKAAFRILAPLSQGLLSCKVEIIK